MLNNIKKFVHSQNNGWIYKLRVLHGKLHMRLIAADYFFWQCITPVKNTVVATAFSGKTYGDNPAYILEKIHELSPNTRIVWLAKEKMTGSVPDYVDAVQYNFSKDMLKTLASASVIIDHNRDFLDFTFNRKKLVIETWHGGLGIKRIGVDAATKMINSSDHTYDFYLSNSDHLTKVYRSAFKYNGHVWKCGYPIEDALLQDNNERQIYRERYGIPENTKIVLYAPTFRSQYKWKCRLNAAQIIDSLQNRFGGNWVMLVHWHPHAKNEDRNLPGAIEAADEDSMQDLVKASDAFISDYSSSIFQAVQCDIPCFIYADDYESYKMDRDMYYSFDEQPFPYALTNEELVDNILNYDSTVWDEKWKQYRIRMGHIVTGHSAEDVAKVCVDFLNGKSKADIMKEIPFETQY